MKNLKPFIYLIVFQLMSLDAFASVIGEGQIMFNTDFSYTSARDLWYGDGTENIFSDNNTDTRVNGKTTYYNIGTTFSYGLPFQMQADLRLDYTRSAIDGATHPNAAAGADGARVNQLSNVALKLIKDFYSTELWGFSGYFQYRHPVEDDPENPTFIAVNDFSQHYVLGVKANYNFASHFSTYFDFKYTFRKAADALEDQDLPADHITTKVDFLFARDDKVSFGAGSVWQHTFSGPDIANSGFAAVNTLTGVPSFFAARERFWAYTMYLNYYVSDNSWVGLSRFKKFWGRNTDRSRTWTLFWGTAF